jgi:O-antigen ligase
MNPETQDINWKRIRTWLIVILSIKVFGFLALFESAGLNKLVKIGLGVSMTLVLLFFLKRLVTKCGGLQIDLKNQLVLIFYLLYFLLALISITWANDYMFATIQLLRDLDLLAFAFLFIVTLRYIQDVTKTHIDLPLFLAFAITISSSYFLIGYFADPDKFMRLTHGGDVARLGGLIMNPNELGMLSSVGSVAILLTFKNYKRKWILVLMLVVNLAVMFLTGSRSSSIGFLATIGLLIFTGNNAKFKFISVIGLAIVAPLVINEVVLDETKGGLDEVMSMTGRLPFWKALLTEGLPKEPFFGYGFMNINYTKFFQVKNSYPASMTHNTFIQVLMNLGLVGFSIVLAQMTMFIRSLIQWKEKTQVIACVCLFIPILVNSLTEFGIWGETNYGILFYQLLFLWFIIKAIRPTPHPDTSRV